MKLTALVSALVILASFTAHNARAAATTLLQITSPKGGELYLVGESQQVVVTSKFKSVTIQLSRDGGATFTDLGIIDNTVKDKTLLNILKYTVPGPTAANCIIRASGVTTKGQTFAQSGVFAITAGNTLGPVLATDLADGSITTPKLADKAVTAPKVGSGAASNNMVLQADGAGGAFWGMLADSELSANVTLKGNTFNAAGKLVLLDNSGNVPVANLPIAGVTPATRGVVYVDQTSIQVTPDGKITAISALPPTVAGGDLTGTYPAPQVATVGGQSAANIASGVQAANGATNLANANTIVKRDASANFAAGTITANLTGTASNATNASNSAALNGKPDTAFSLVGHNHFGETWTGSTTTSGLSITNNDTTNLSTAIFGQTLSTSGAALSGNAPATSGTTFGVAGQCASPAGVGVAGSNTSTSGMALGVFGGSSSTTGQGVQGFASSTTGANFGVVGQSASTTGTGVTGFTTATTGINAGVSGQSASIAGTGVAGFATATSGVNYGVFGKATSASGYAGGFQGNVIIAGSLSKSAGTFKIDHPLDPANKYLSHSFVESPDMKNIYDGVVTLDTNGEATIELPAYFQTLNRDFRYQLTCIGGFAPVYIAGEIAGNRFKIAGGKPSLKVSWQVTGIRQDAYAKAHPVIVEQEKSADERGLYLNPVENGQPIDKGMMKLKPAAKTPITATNAR
ncbi:MAG TPA: hypothetical protein VKX17_03375 [Planctomycetota bacterium]|nr:hypothetical protein [Planctomycetota bacterium]